MRPRRDLERHPAEDPTVARDARAAAEPAGARQRGLASAKERPGPRGPTMPHAWRPDARGSCFFTAADVDAVRPATGKARNRRSVRASLAVAVDQSIGRRRFDGRTVRGAARFRRVAQLRPSRSAGRRRASPRDRTRTKPAAPFVDP
ncbi:hypothetical protein ME121_3828 [Methylobacterium sp. ME121]|nr:hypothetical protein ME121_3828 [Methylobacterium sp. ME121]